MLSKYLDPKNDIAFRKIFGTEKNKDILIHFINDIMKFEEDEQIQEVTFLSPLQDPEIAYKKQSIVDVLCESKSGTKIIVEMQVSPSRGFEKRAQYYAAKTYSRQLMQGQGEEGVYSKLKEVIFIAICSCKIFPKKAGYLSHHVILDKQSYTHDLKDFSFTFVELPKFPLNKIPQLKTMIEKWCYFFKYAHRTKEAEVQQITGNDIAIERAYEALNQFNWSERELLAYEQETKRVMDNLAAEAYRIEEAESRGMEKGMEKGKKETAIEIAKQLLNIGLPADAIIACTGLSAAQLDALKPINQ